MNHLVFFVCITALFQSQTNGGDYWINLEREYFGNCDLPWITIPLGTKSITKKHFRFNSIGNEGLYLSQETTRELMHFPLFGASDEAMERLDVSAILQGVLELQSGIKSFVISINYNYKDMEGVYNRFTILFNCINDRIVSYLKLSSYLWVSSDFYLYTYSTRRGRHFRLYENRLMILEEISLSSNPDNQLSRGTIIKRKINEMRSKLGLSGRFKKIGDFTLKKDGSIIAVFT